MSNKSPYLPPFLILLLVLIMLLPAVAADTNSTPPQQQPIQLVSMERALSVLGSVNNTILFVDRQIAVAERDRKDLVAAVANLASARGVLKGAVAAFDGGDYVKVVELSSEAARRAQYALVAIPATSPKPAPQSASVTFEQANSAIKSANETVLFVDVQIADAERARKDVIKPVETLAEARGLFKQASAAFVENDYAGARVLASDATTKAQDALAILSEAKSPEVLTPKVIAVSATAIVLVALVVYFGPIRGRLRAKPQQAPIQYWPVPYPRLLPPPMTSPYYQQQNQPPTMPAQAQQPAPYYYRQQAQPYYYYAAQPKPFTLPPIRPSPAQQQQPQQPLLQQPQATRPQQPWQQQQQPFPQQQAIRPQQPWQQQPQAPQPNHYPQPLLPYQKPPQKKQQPWR